MYLILQPQVALYKGNSSNEEVNGGFSTMFNKSAYSMQRFVNKYYLHELFTNIYKIHKNREQLKKM